MPQILIEDSGNLKQPKNVKSINNTTVSHLVSCCVIPWPATIKGWGKEVFWKIHRLVVKVITYNLNNIIEENTWKVTVLKVNLFRKIFQVFSWNYNNFFCFTRNSKNNCFAKYILMPTSVFHISQFFSNTKNNN